MSASIEDKPFFLNTDFVMQFESRGLKLGFPEFDINSKFEKC